MKTLDKNNDLVLDSNEFYNHVLEIHQHMSEMEKKGMIYEDGHEVSIDRLRYCYHILKKIEEFKDKPEIELEEIASKHNPWNILKTIFNPYSNSEADYDAVKAVENMRILGLEDFKLDKQSVSGLYCKLYDLQRDAKRQRKKTRRKENV